MMTRISLSFLAESRSLQQLYAFLNESPFTTKFVGGCVRDSLLNRVVTDVDMATTALPDSVVERLQHHGIKTLKHGLEHGTITAVLANKQRVEITTLRKDIKTDGRHAVVAFTEDWTVDAARRDFTMNALYADDTGQIYDPLGTGITDAQQGIVRFIGNAQERITEDALRILRYFRFLPLYHKIRSHPLDIEALNACKKLSKMIERLSGERIQQEMLKVLEQSHPLHSLQLMQQTGVLDYVLDDALYQPSLKTKETGPLPSQGILPEYAKIGRIPCEGRGPESFRNLIGLVLVPDLSNTSLLAKLQETAHPHSPMVCYLWALLGGNRHAIERITHRWKLPRALSSQLLILSDVNPLEIDLRDNATRWRLIDENHYSTLYDIIMLYCATHDCSNTPLHQALIEEAFESRLLKFPLSGKDLKAIGITEGIALGDALRAARQAWVERGFTLDKKALLATLNC
jgi:poly(A) polymerase